MISATMYIPALFLLGLGFTSAVILAIASRLFYVWEDPKIEEVMDSLLGANCGGCGYAGCAAAAAAVVAGKAGPDVCVAGGSDIALDVARIMGIEISLKEPEISCSYCRYATADADRKFIYEGMDDCIAASYYAGGPKECNIGCLGFGSCVKACPFGAIKMGEYGLPVFDSNKCTGCGICVEICPKHVIRLTSATERIQHLYREDECTSPCQRECPAGIDIREYISQIKKGNYKQALRTIKERNPLPLTCGRVCPHPCEDMCRRTIVGEPVNINHLKRFVADIELKSGEPEMPYIAPATGKKVAIIGGGPAGLSAAYYLVRLGHSPTIFEAMPKLGGMLRYGIPEYRLPKATLDWEINSILKVGVDVKTDKRMGRDFTISSLKEDGFEAVFLGTGAWDSRNLGIEGDDLKGVIPGTHFLIDRGLDKETPIGDKVVVVGGGNTALDAARTCWRLGAKEVTVIYRRSRKEMPANDIEVEEGEKEGVIFQFLSNPTKLMGENGVLKQLEYTEMELGEPDESGRRRPVPKKGSEKIMDVDNVIVAAGQFPETDFLQEDGVKLTDWKTIEVLNEITGETNIPGVFAGGDVVTGASIAVAAIGAGRRAARSINIYLNGEEVGLPDNIITPACQLPVIKELRSVSDSPRTMMPELEVDQRKLNFKEVELGLTEEQARYEADRCLMCGLICYRKDDTISVN
ncbi:MAG: FAD-dependent oxidoreductase [Spirochaetes bacterium]|nr:FAD-dependent oxidoreductase [Spirochaetota bacterium]